MYTEKAVCRGEEQCVTAGAPHVDLDRSTGRTMSSGQHTSGDARFIAKPANCTETGHGTDRASASWQSVFGILTGNPLYSVRPCSSVQSNKSEPRAAGWCLHRQADLADKLGLTLAIRPGIVRLLSLKVDVDPSHESRFLA